MADEKKQLLIVTGMSGAGKTVVAHDLEDMGYFVVDNLPPTLLGSFWDLINNSNDFHKVAVVIDLRVKSFYTDLLDEVNSLEDNGNVQATILFLDASDDVLVARYKETRRLPPLANNGKGRLLDGIQEERHILTPIKNRSNYILDTSNLSTKELKKKLINAFSDRKRQPFSIEVMSFGFKYGMPIDADIVMDVRFLPNPFYIPELRPFTGLDKRWTNMDKHEMYCAGHMIEAGVAYYQATGKRKLLDVCVRMVDHMMSIFGPGKRHWVPGHEEIELALVKLYQVTNEEKYLDFAYWLLEERGHGYGSMGGEGTWNKSYYQDDKPVREMTDIAGHAVRCMYLYCGMADVAAIKRDSGYIAALDRLWEDVVLRNMYITGGLDPRNIMRDSRRTMICQILRRIARLALQWVWFSGTNV